MKRDVWALELAKRWRNRGKEFMEGEWGYKKKKTERKEESDTECNESTVEEEDEKKVQYISAGEDADERVQGNIVYQEEYIYWKALNVWGLQGQIQRWNICHKPRLTILWMKSEQNKKLVWKWVTVSFDNGNVVCVNKTDW